jgi:hypothetical protein
MRENLMIRIDDTEFDARLTAALYRAAELDYEEQFGGDYVRNRRRPPHMRAFRNAAAVFAMVAVLFGATLAVSPTVRAAVSNFTRSWFADRTRYTVTGPDVIGEWTFGYIPEGFELVHEADSELSIFHVYENEKAELVIISISAESTIVDNEHYDFYQMTVSGYPTDVYESNDPLYPNMLVVYKGEEAVIIAIISEIDVNELIKIAEGISK